MPYYYNTNCTKKSSHSFPQSSSADFEFCPFSRVLPSSRSWQIGPLVESSQILILRRLNPSAGMARVGKIAGNHSDIPYRESDNYQLKKGKKSLHGGCDGAVAKGAGRGSAAPRGTALGNCILLHENTQSQVPKWTFNGAHTVRHPRPVGSYAPNYESRSRRKLMSVKFSK